MTTELPEFRIIEVSKDYKPILQNLLHLYLYDLSDSENSDCDSNGRFDYPRLDNYWAEPDRHAFLVYVGANYAGFILINRHSEISTPDIRSIAEFFILKKYRRKGLGREAAKRILTQFPGKWEIAQRYNNQSAQTFWEKVIRSLVGDKFKSQVVENREKVVLLSFEI